MNTNFRKLIFFVLVVGVTFVAYRYVIMPAKHELEEKQAKVSAKYDKLAEFEERNPAGTEDLNKQLQKTQEAITFFESRIPPTSEIYKVLERVSVLAQKNGLTPKTIRTLEKKENGGYVEQPLKMELNGDFDSFYRFLLEMEKMPRIVKIRQLDMKKQSEDGKISADFVVSIFFSGENTKKADKSA